MRLFPLILACVTLGLLAACSTPDSRISSNRATFESYPPPVQAAIRAGRVEVGFNPGMVLMALGEPARKFTRTTDRGELEVWGYHDNAPQFSFGLGFASGGRGSAMGGGVGVSSGGYDPEEKTRVEFQNGHVTAVESLTK
jgi:hypothetical protein